MLGTNVGPALTSAVIAYAIEAVRRKEFFSKYTLVNAVEIFATTWAGQASLMWVPDMGFIGLGSSISSAAIAGLIYAVARRYIQDERDMKAKNFGYGFGLALAGDIISAPVFNAIGSTKLNIGTLELNVGAGAGNLRADLPPSNVNNPPGSATPLNAPQMSSSGAYANPCWWR